MRRLAWVGILALMTVLFQRSVSAQTEKILLAIGDSTTAGTPGFRSPVEAPPNGAGDERSQYAYWVRQRRPDWRVLNRGVNGQRSDQILKRFRSDLPQFRPDRVAILAGVNDLYQGYPPEEVQKNLEQMYRLARERGISVIACTILPYDSASAETLGRMRQVNDWIRQYSQQQGLTLCDLFRVMEDPARPGKLIRTADGLHPDVEGYRHMGEAVAECLPP